VRTLLDLSVAEFVVDLVDLVDVALLEGAGDYL
jgi:hypothetical protein